MLERGRGSSQRGNADMLSPSLRRDPVMAGSNGAWKPHVAEASAPVQLQSSQLRHI